MRGNVPQICGIAGVCAIIAAGILGAVGTSENELSSGSSGPVDVGSTETVTTPPAEPATSVAAPALKGPAPLPPEEQGLPG
jgi:hypothetical protein